LAIRSVDVTVVSITVESGIPLLTELVFGALCLLHIIRGHLKCLAIIFFVIASSVTAVTLGFGLGAPFFVEQGQQCDYTLLGAVSTHACFCFFFGPRISSGLRFLDVIEDLEDFVELVSSFRFDFSTFNDFDMPVMET
jgi:hypothetical protein